MKATWNGVEIAHSDETVVVERNHYFPSQAVDPAALKPSATTQTKTTKPIRRNERMTPSGVGSVAIATSIGAR